MKMRMSFVVGFMTVLVIPAVIAAALDVSVTDAPEGPAFARFTALRYVLANYPELEGIVNPSSIRTPWTEDNLTPQDWIGTNIVQYSKGYWTVTVSEAVVKEPVYAVEIEFTSEGAFTWKGAVDQAGNVAPILFTQ